MRVGGGGGGGEERYVVRRALGRVTRYCACTYSRAKRKWAKLE